MKEFRNEDGTLISTVNNLSKEIEVETVFHGKSKAEHLRIYFDADHPNPDGRERPQVVIILDDDGRSVKKIIVSWMAEIH